ncbi:hypothetical protein JKP88DRAFT_216455 [Tribonema minus]|uniref:CHRD domain-containing protein n=1 Tax=Tribonema minus TaxID=303371 RepID=A0A835YI34_9STRA|nr:hypothetical protein JKP88DRAFT_216455 [Tribonema minus]
MPAFSRCFALTACLAVGAAAPLRRTSAPTDAPTAAPSTAPVNLVNPFPVVQLDGTQEVDPTGDPNGGGTATFFTPDDETICFSIDTTLDGVTAGHIHKGVVGTNGDVVVDLLSVLADTKVNPLEGCVDLGGQRPLLAILENPAGFYVNIHNIDFPKGAIRGQMS